MNVKSVGWAVALGLGLAACGQKEEGFSIVGKIGGGLEDGTVVRLMDMEQEPSKGVEIVRDTVRSGGFILKGKVESPTLCRVEIEVTRYYEGGKPYEAKTQTMLMVENVPMTMEAARLDSIPLTWEFRKSPLQKERNVRVMAQGGRAQKEYNEYREALHALELAAWEADNRVWTLRYADDRMKEPDTDSLAWYTRLAKEAEQKVSKARDHFVQEHPGYAISVYLAQQKADATFAYTVEELNALAESASVTYDTLRLVALRQAVEEAKAYAKGVAYRDFLVVTEQGVEKNFSDFYTPGKYVLIDFWASWCVPCRASVPQVKELAAACGDKLTVLSVSLDRSEADWKKAVREEQMPWRQLILPSDREKQREATEGYKFNAIPYMVLINPEGKVLCGTHSPDEVSEVLEKELPL